MPRCPSPKVAQTPSLRRDVAAVPVGPSVAAIPTGYSLAQRPGKDFFVNVGKFLSGKSRFRQANFRQISRSFHRTVKFAPAPNSLISLRQVLIQILLRVVGKFSTNFSLLSQNSQVRASSQPANFSQATIDSDTTCSRQFFDKFLAPFTEQSSSRQLPTRYLLPPVLTSRS